MTRALAYVAARLQEPSTWAGVAAGLVAAATRAPAAYAVWIAVAAAFCGGVAAWMKDPGR